jgi:hypothetical protein
MPFLHTFFRTGTMILALLGLIGSSAAPCRALAWEEKETVS